MRFSLNRAASVHLVLRTRSGKQWRQLATVNVNGHKGITTRHLAGRWKGKAGSLRSVQLLVQLKDDKSWRTSKTLKLAVRHKS
jgi:hypothetical protein